MNQLATDPKTMATNRGCFPEEILFEIFTRLPIKSLGRFRCVSKLWLSIISYPNFVAAHLARSRSRPKLLISVQYVDPLRNDEGMCAFFSIEYPDHDRYDSGAQQLRATSHSPIGLDYISRISSSSHSGLICFTCNNSIKIGNPITGDFGVVPYPKSESGGMSNIAWCRSLFFGFDRVDTTRPVILKLDLCDYTTTDDPNLPYIGKSRVFDLVENCWHDSEPHPWLGVAAKSHVCIDGVIYISANSAAMVVSLYAFDVGSRSFRMIERPPESLPPYEDQRFMVELLIEYNGRVALVCDVDSESTTENEIMMWVLDDPDKHIWSFKSFVVPWGENLAKDEIGIDSLESIHNYSNQKVNLFGATHQGELIFATSIWNCPCFLFFYEIETGALRRFEVDGFGNIPHGPVRFNWVVESLESPKGFN